ncbi:MAG: hypothetical protein NUV74_00645 [Candidatus Brocadiaceae bacterium]|nr:hypothetical protein [Candidatus Brocadiaceae bacterium]
MRLLDFISEKELKEAVLCEYERRLVLYKLTDERFKKKYEMNFTEFEKKNIVREKGFSWDVEKDAMEWEHVIEGIESFQEKIRKIKESDERT